MTNGLYGDFFLRAEKNKKSNPIPILIIKLSKPIKIPEMIGLNQVPKVFPKVKYAVLNLCMIETFNWNTILNVNYIE